MFNLNRALRACLAVSAALSLSACATVTRGTSEAFTVNTDPSGAAVRTTAGFACDATPCTWKMPRKAEFDVTITKPGYKTVQTHVVHQVSSGGGAAMAGNVILGGLIGAGVDVATGAMMELKPNPLTVKLESEAATIAAADGK
jgi:membrane-bound inhibitor of C-type lysozyme